MTNGKARFSFRAVMVLIIAVFAAGFSTALAQTATEAPTEAATEAPTEAATEVATEAPTEAATEVATEAATEEAVADLPETGQGSTSQGNSNFMLLLLLATGMLFMGGGFLISRNKRA